MQSFYKKNITFLRPLLFIIGGAIGVYLFFIYCLPFVAPFIIGWLFSLMFHPFVSFLERKLRCPRWLGSLFASFLLLLLMATIVFGIFHKLYAELLLFYNNWPAHQRALHNTFNSIFQLTNDFLSGLPSDMQLRLALSEKEITGFISAFLEGLLQGGGSLSLNTLMAIPNALMIFFVALVSSYFFTKDKQAIENGVRAMIPKSFGSGVALTNQKLRASLAGYFRAQLILMMFAFVICVFGLLILGSPYTLLLSVVISVIDALPFFGSGFILWPGAVLHLLNGNVRSAAGYMIIWFCVNLMRQVLQPKILGTEIGLHPLLTLFSMYVGLQALGFLGMIIGPAIAVLIKAGYESNVRDDSVQP